MTEPNPDDWLKAYPIVDRAKALPHGERQAFIERACHGNPGLLAAVTRLMTKVESSSAWGEGAPLDPQDAVGDLVGESVDGFEILRLLGQGGMGTVYVARQGRPHREVALKMLRANWLDPERQRRFQKETEVLAKLSHPHIASLYQCGTWKRPGDITVPYFVMEYVEGARGIVRYCQEQGLDLRQRLRLLCSVLEALDYGHGRGIVHRDLKPENLLVDPAGHPRVIDFGLARVVEGEDPFKTRASADSGIIGTLAYMAPEQYSDAGEITIRTDVYALGLILYELLCDKPAIKLKATTLPAALSELTRNEIPSPSQAVPGLPSDMDCIVRKASQRDPNQRYATAANMAQDLDDHLEGRPLSLAPSLASLETGSHRPRAALVVAGTLALGLVIGRLWPEALVRATKSPAEEVANQEEGASILELLTPESSGLQPLVLSTEVDRSLSLPPADDSVSTVPLQFRQGRYKLAGGSLKLVGLGKEAGLQVGVEAEDQGEVELINARLTATGSTRVGVKAGSHGLLHIGRRSRLWTAGREGGGWLTTLIGDYGTGELLITEGGQLHADNVLCVGGAPLKGRPGSSKALVTGAHSQIYTWHLRIGDGHNGKVAVTLGGRIVVERTIKIGGMVDREGTLAVTYGGDVTVVRPSREFGALAASIGSFGKGSIEVLSGSRFLADGLINVGMETGSSGTILVGGGSTFIAGDLRLAPGFRAEARVDVHGADSHLVARRLFVGTSESQEATVTVVDGGRLLVEATLDIAPAGRLTLRDGHITCEQLKNGGELVFENASLSGDLRCTQDATVELVVAQGPGSALHVTGQVVIAGTLRVVVQPEFLRSGDPVPLIVADSIEGEFSRVVFDPEIDGARVVTGPKAVSLVFD
jgi:serine/threonine protein kinase